MAKTRTDWTRNVSLRTAATLAASTTENEDLNIATLGGTFGADRVDFQIDILIGSSTRIDVEIFGSSDNGTTFDTIPLEAYTVTANDTRTVIADGPYRRIALTNVTGGVSGNITIVYAWRQWDTT